MNILKNLLKTTLLFTFICQNTYAEKSNPCPSTLVSFWNEFASSTNNLHAIPEFLVKNQCLSVKASTVFYTTTAERFDYPEKAKLVADLYAQLNWNAASPVLK